MRWRRLHDGSPDVTKPSKYNVEVRFSDFDLFGHLNHARYLAYCEEHRSSFLPEMARHTGIDLLGSGFVIARIECDYISPLGPSTRLVQVAMIVNKLGRTSLDVEYAISGKGVSHAKIRSIIILVDRDGSPRPLTDVERTYLSGFQRPDLEDLNSNV